MNDSIASLSANLFESQLFGRNQEYTEIALQFSRIAQVAPSGPQVDPLTILAVLRNDEIRKGLPHGLEDVFDALKIGYEHLPNYIRDSWTQTSPRVNIGSEWSHSKTLLMVMSRIQAVSPEVSMLLGPLEPVLSEFRNVRNVDISAFSPQAVAQALSVVAQYVSKGVTNMTGRALPAAAPSSTPAATPSSAPAAAPIAGPVPSVDEIRPQFAAGVGMAKTELLKIKDGNMSFWVENVLGPTGVMQTRILPALCKEFIKYLQDTPKSKLHERASWRNLAEECALATFAFRTSAPKNTLHPETKKRVGEFVRPRFDKFVEVYFGKVFPWDEFPSLQDASRLMKGDMPTIDPETAKKVYDGLKAQLSRAILSESSNPGLAQQVVAALDDPHQISQLYKRWWHAAPVANSGSAMGALLMLDHVRRARISPEATVSYLFDQIRSANVSGGVPTGMPRYPEAYRKPKSDIPEQLQATDQPETSEEPSEEELPSQWATPSNDWLSPNVVAVASMVLFKLKEDSVRHSDFPSW